jgi:hypothetical protein
MKKKTEKQVQTVEKTGASYGESEEEIKSFLRAIDSYPAHAAGNPRLSFREHLCSLLTPGHGAHSGDRRS